MLSRFFAQSLSERRDVMSQVALRDLPDGRKRRIALPGDAVWRVIDLLRLVAKRRVNTHDDFAAR